MTGRSGTALYLHLPFCRVKCTYCAFAISTDQRLEQRYVSALVDEMRRRVSRDAAVESVYFGGGTPSRTSAESLRRVADALSKFVIEEGAEMTLEANPEDVDSDRLRQWRDELGVNRLSIGVQSFHDRELQPLGRQHGGSGATDAIARAAAAVDRISVDLILGLPGQTVESVGESTRLALESGAGHISLYILDLEPGSALEGRVRSGSEQLPEDETTAEMYREVVRLTEAGGLRQYEVSNFARPGEEAIHNRRYWQRKPYIGVGLGAHSFDGACRRGNTRSIHEYMTMVEAGEDPVHFEERLTPEDVRHEEIFLGLRQPSGLEVARLRELSSAAEDWIAESLEMNWIEISEDNVRFTIEGFLLSDELISRLF